ncbi:hypothetical protein OKA05_02080 [Luteolibacter arcticus]|uniref:Uncharacterized protein n=1 Tax=Luteolibacter arcticus TaxID=1581411 RepID=A0ABT3GD02_9BACT|nr:hypothetical protein [Luteolibacter arcticus]MCW1921321.1 hypothetical protein [Luteolibacter arcticus]
MRLTVDLQSLQLIISAGDRKRLSLVEFKRGDSTPLEVQFVRAGVAEALPEGSVLSFGLKESGKYDGDFAVFFDEFAAPTATPNFIYAGTPNFNTEELDDLLFVDGTSANDKASVDLMGEFSWAVGEADPVSIRTFTCRVHNDVIRGDEGTPLPLPSPEDWLAAHGIVYDPAIIGLTGGGATTLDGIEVSDVAAGRLQAVFTAPRFAIYRLNNGAATEAEPTVVVPDDDATKHWGLVSILAANLKIPSADGWFGTLEADDLTADRTYQLPDRPGTLIPFINIVANTTDNAGLSLVSGVFKLVMRHQTANTWHELKIVDSSGTPTLSISSAL